MQVMVKPFYGWGWSEGENLYDVPPHFELQLETILGKHGNLFQTALGRLQQKGHPLDGFWILLSARHVEPDEDYNLAVFEDRPDLADIRIKTARIVGFAQVQHL